MAGIRRRFFNVLTLLSLLLCVAVAGLWVRSYRATDVLMMTWPSGRGIVQTARGGVGFTIVAGGDWSGETGVTIDRRTPPGHRLQSLAEIYQVSGPYYRAWDGGGAGYIVSRPPKIRRSYFAAVLPCWVVCGASAAPAASRLIGRWRRSRRNRRGLCAACGYDLRATPGRCPECGAAAGKTDGGGVAGVVKP